MKSMEAVGLRSEWVTACRAAEAMVEAMTQASARSAAETSMETRAAWPRPGTSKVDATYMSAAVPASPEAGSACGICRGSQQPASSECYHREDSQKPPGDASKPLRHQQSLLSHYTLRQQEKHGKSYGGGAPEKEDVVTSVVICGPERPT
jgi:hypothetical protein